MSSVGALRIGQPPENRRQRLIKLCWTLLWMIYLVYPIGDLVSGRHTVPAQVAGWVALAVFLVCYSSLVLRRQVRGEHKAFRPLHLGLLLAMAAIGTACCYTLGSNWLTLLSYTAVATGAVLPPRYCLQGVAGVTLFLVVVGSTCRDVSGLTTGTAALSAFLGGAAMTGLQALISTVQELREARAAVAALSASAERLRLARDLHDLLGHSLSLITLKTELTARFLDQERYQEARAQVTDIEKVSRQALADVRAAVGGYRRPTLAVELVAVRTALAAADVAVDADPAVAGDHPGLGPGGGGGARLGAARGRHQRRPAQRGRLLRDQAGRGGGRGRFAGAAAGGPGRRGRGPASRPWQRPDRPRGAAGAGRRDAGDRSGTARPGLQRPGHGSAAGAGVRPGRRVVGRYRAAVIRILLAEDQGMVREALAALLGLEADIDVVAQVSRGDQVVEAATAHDVEVAVLDIEMPGLTGIEAAALLRRERPGTRIVIVTTFGRPGYLRRAMEAGADAFLVKDAPASELAEAVRRVLRGERVIDPTLAAAALADGADPLTSREREVLAAAADGSANNEVAKRLHLSEGTVRNYLSAAIQKTGARNRAEAVRIAREKGWL